MACITLDELKTFKEYCEVTGIENNFLNYMIWKENIALNKLKVKHFIRNNGGQ